jgi:hypothetical protein
MDDLWMPPSAQPRAPAPSRGRLSRKHKRDGPDATADLPRRATKITRLDPPDTHIAACSSSIDNTPDAAGNASRHATADASGPAALGTPRPDASPARAPPPTATGETKQQQRTKVVLQPNGIARPLRVPFDPYHANPAGHQVGEGPGADASWRARRQGKLAAQFGGGIARCFARAAAAKSNVPPTTEDRGGVADEEAIGAAADEECAATAVVAAPLDHAAAAAAVSAPHRSRILRGVVVYVDGSTAPLVSDHRLRYLVAQHGGCVSAYLARRSVTHVVLTRKANAPPPLTIDPQHAAAAAAAAALDEATAPLSSPKPGPTTRFRAAGGGLAAGKVQREIARRRGAGVKYVTAAWVLESVRAGRRLPEWRFSDWSMAHEKQIAVSSYFCASKTDDVDETTTDRKCSG